MARGPASGVRVLAVVAALTAAATVVLAEPSPTPRFSWLFDGDVFGVAQAGNTIYVGGDFSTVFPGSTAAGHLVALSPTTGSRTTPAPPVADEIVTAIAPDSDGGYYLAGRFTTFGRGAIVRGQNTRLAHVRGDGSVDTGFAPDITGSITSLAFAGPSIVVMGDVSAGGFQRLIVVDAVTGQVRPWTPVLPSAAPRLLHAVATEGVIYVLWDDTASSYVTAFDGGSGLVAWTTAVPGRVPVFSGSGEGIIRAPGALALAGARLVVGLDRVLAVERANGAVDTLWGGGRPNLDHGYVSAFYVHGSAVYAAGSFLTAAGQSRHYLAAFAIANGGLLPWAPNAKVPVDSLVVAADGTVFAGASFGGPLLNLQSGRGIAAIDAAGGVTGWAAQPTFSHVTAMALSTTGTLIAGTSLVTAGGIARSGLAGFDATTGALLPQVALVVGAGEYVSDIVASGTTLFVAVRDGSAATVVRAVDTTGAGPPTTVETTNVSALGAADAKWIYVNGSEQGGTWISSRYDVASLARDPDWRSTYRVVAATPHLIGADRSNVVVLDPVTGAPLRFVPLPVPEFVASDGDTVYQLSTIPGTSIAVQGAAFDAVTGLAVTGPAVSGRLLAVAAADGRLFFGGADISTPSGIRSGLIETDRRGVPTAWNPGFGHSGPAAPGVVRRVVRHGDRLIATGSAGFWNSRLTVFDLRGPTAPAALRRHDSGAGSVLEWAPATNPAPAASVLEGGTAPGRTDVQLPVGNATAFALPANLRGPLYVRVRSAVSGETSNEIVVGCSPPVAPTGLTATLWPGGVTLTWQPAAGATSYAIVAGITSRGREIGTLPIAGTQTSFASPAPAGTYFVRVQAANACGTSGESGETFFTAGSTVALPPAPAQPVATISGATVSLAWNASTTPAAKAFVLEVGRTAGQADLLTLRIPRVTVVVNGVAYDTFTAANVPAGTYHLRVRAINAAGAGPPSLDTIAVVP